MKSVEVGGIRLAYEEYGSGEPILFLHGFGASSYSWREVAKAISKNGSRRTISLNLMGFGYSDKPTFADYSITNQARMVIDFIKALELKSLSLAGHSYGGGVSLMTLYLHDHQDLPFEIKNLILLSSPCFPMPMPHFLKLLSIPLLPRLLLKILSPKKVVFQMIRYDLPDLDIHSETVDEYAKSMSSPGCHRAMTRMARKIVPENLDSLVEWYPSVRIPCLFLWGKWDGLIPVHYAEKLHQVIENSKLVVLEDCGHIPQERYPDLVHGHILKFLDS